MKEDLPPLPEFDLYGFTPYRLAVAAKRTSEELARQYRERFGISIPEWRVLVHLAHSGKVSVRDIEARVAMEKYEVSRAAKRLREAGLIERRENPDDRRLVILSLTPKGRQMMAELLPLAQSHQTALEARLGAAFDQLEAGLEALLKETE
ncbi:transcriptional regulator marR/emrR family protein [Pseudooceanicola batsensis HTCC2597]|uniref:Transcriptional regulator marR/emrR family protein n=1 Tax=Pseudooceanicola batsensis (strain ATCC BAA-863 / DSM 15984 / KCTC 12145 / HTCC2597) TaxID=252305 RepID=A3U0M1_PSEBH|nr:MarR family winged helix-turn-helix transcriptional regulator [Pseudooceanicola batsensis]EAQ02312.1 transcriptional regulator marR/emrR family protein [Pseudooceanicola batsensis HTCC2597]